MSEKDIASQGQVYVDGWRDALAEIASVCEGRSTKDQLASVCVELIQARKDLSESQVRLNKLAEAVSIVREQTIFEISEIIKHDIETQLDGKSPDDLPAFENGEVRGMHHCYSFMKRLLDVPGDD